MSAEASAMDFAERLGPWVNAFEAIRLQAAQQLVRGIRTAAAPAMTARRAVGVAEDLQRLRATLAHAIGQPVPAAGDEADAGYAPFQQRHLKLQRDMEQTITALRDHVRQVLGRVSPRLRQLATLDAALEQVIAPREQALLPGVIALLQRRFEQLRAGQAEGWLQAFGKDWRQALLAELELRLEPVTGLVDALNEELKNRE